MKTYKECIDKAIQIADENEFASVAIFIHPRNFNLEDIAQDERYNPVTKTYKALNGSSVRFFNLDTDIYDIAGYLFSHIMVCGTLSREMQQYLKSKVRSVYSFKEPMGYYHIFGTVERMEVW